MSEQATPAPANCPFFGRHTILAAREHRGESGPQILLREELGNECGLITGRLAPCELAVAGQPVDWRACRVIPDHTYKTLRT